MGDDLGRLNGEFQIRGKLGDVVYQGVDPRFANAATPTDKRRQCRTNLPQRDPMTPAQLAARARFRMAVAAWQALSAAEKERWTRMAPTLFYTGRYRRTYRHYANGFTAYVGRWLRTNGNPG